MTEGWSFILGSTRMHYFKGDTSLCKKWPYIGIRLTVVDGSRVPMKLRCKACTNRVHKENGK